MKKSWMVWLFVLPLAVGLAARTAQQLVWFDPESGFTTDGGVTAVLATAALAVGAAGLQFLFRRGRFPATGQVPVPACKAAGGCGLAAGALMLAYAVGMMVRAASSGAAGPAADGTVDSMADHPLVCSLVALFGIAAGIVLLVEGASLLRGKNLLRAAPVFALAPQLWGCAALISQFLRFTEVANTAENLYQTFWAIFLLLFFSAQAKLFAGLDEPQSVRLAFANGASAVLVGLALAVPDLIAGLAGTNGLDRSALWERVLILGLCAYAAAYLYALRGTIFTLPPAEAAGVEENPGKF